MSSSLRTYSALPKLGEHLSKSRGFSPRDKENCSQDNSSKIISQLISAQESIMAPSCLCHSGVHLPISVISGGLDILV